ncbi:hypothetical protein [Acidovorax sp. HMWF018]|uniref:hypothetical protein n=1 Tax=Acidovorax sp. HMWF018 TaxID=2056855 RepID=UPI001E55047E|nr:hypothetical protein [Acidovorax sp. HMWF018]
MGFDLSPQNFEQAMTFSKYLAESEMVPKQYRGRPGDCLIAMQWGHEIGLKPLQALQSIAPVNGKPNLYGDAGKAMLLAAGCEIEEDDTAIIRATGTARCKITRPGRRPVERTFSIEDAKTAQLWGKAGPWTTSPYRQMAWRAFWFAARDAAADLLRGMGGKEEADDLVRSKDMGPADEVKPEPTPYPAEQFAANLPKWREVIQGARKTADDLIAFTESRNPNTPMTEEQKATLRGIKPVKNAAATDVTPKNEAAAPTADPGPAITFAQVSDKLHAAKDVDSLNLAADLVSQVPDTQQQAELNALYEQRLGELERQ